MIKSLCAFPHPGYDVFRRQADELDVREVEWERQLELRLRDGAPVVVDPAIVRIRFIGEAEYVDDDGAHVSFLLHAADGKLRFLEILKTPEPSPVLNRQPPLSRLHFIDPLEKLSS